jgi:hypothetical protein
MEHKLLQNSIQDIAQDTTEAGCNTEAMSAIP